MLAQYLPCVIETDEEQDRLAEILMRMTIPPRQLPVEEERLVALLGHLIEDYESRANQGKTKHLTPVELLTYLMEEGGLRQVDLVDVFGAQSVVSAVLAGKRPINLDHARKLAARFRMPMEAFVR
ncbi:MAG: hypothetical protein U0Q16_12575 [Bryobacteraceae bacterium]